MTSPVCPVCSDEVVRMSGDVQSEYMIIGSVPSDEEIKYHKPFTGGTGQIFRRELFRHADIDLSTCRTALLWYHANNKNDDCLSISTEMIMEELPTKKVIILVGAQAVSYFTDLSVDKVNGLEITEYTKLGDEKYINPDFSRIFALVNPGTVFLRGVGELRFGLRAIKKEIGNE